MKLLKEKESRATLITLVLLALCALLPNVASSFVVFLLTKALILSLASMQYILLSGYGGMSSFAHISFYGIVAYILSSGTVIFSMSYSSALILAFAGVLAVVLLFALIAVQTNGKYFMMMSIAFCQLIYLCAVQWVNLTRGINGVAGVPFPKLFGITISDRNTVFYFILVIVTLCYLFMKRLIASPYGIALQGVRDNQKKMAALGYSVKLQRYVAIVLTALLSGVAGFLSVIFYRGIAPESVALSMGTVLIFISIIGCALRLEGAFAGALAYVLIEDITSQYTERYKMLIGVLFILTVLFMNKGILGIDLRNTAKKCRNCFKKAKKAAKPAGRE